MRDTKNREIMIMTIHKVMTIVVVLLGGALFATSAKAIDFIQAVQAIEPIKPASNINLAQAELGKKLFFEPRLSKSGRISCHSCHNLSMGGSNQLETFITPNGKRGSLNVPTVLNSSLSLAQNWDGLTDNLQSQARKSLQSPEKMDSSHALSIKVLQSIPEYVQAFKHAFDRDVITIDDITQAIAEFERTLLTPNSRFDQWLMGKKDALTPQELTGYKLFQENDCITCHNGVGIGGNLYEEIGLFNEGTDAETEFKTFKVPTLRNIALTAPYFHDGKVQTLAKAVKMMGRLQLDENFSKDEVVQLVAFLKTLTGDQPNFALPELPPSTKQTPRP